MTFVDELTIFAKAGDGGDGVVRWHREKFKPKGGPAGGNGGRGGDVYVKAVRDLNLLSKYTGKKSFLAANGEAGSNESRYGKAGEDLYIELPVGSTVTDVEKGREFELSKEGQCEKILQGGRGGLGNEHFKSSTNRSPEQSTKGQTGEEGTFSIELSLVVDVGLVGMPNAGKSTLINLLTNAKSAVGDYQFTTLSPHLGEFYGYALVDIPGLIEGASEGKGLGHRFLKHVERTKMILHLVSLEADDPKNSYYTIREELSNYNKDISDKEEWIVFTKKDLVKQEFLDKATNFIDNNEKRVFVISKNDPDSIKNLHDALIKHLRSPQ